VDRGKTTPYHAIKKKKKKKPPNKGRKVSEIYFLQERGDDKGVVEKRVKAARRGHQEYSAREKSKTTGFFRSKRKMSTTVKVMKKMAGYQKENPKTCRRDGSNFNRSRKNW